MWLIPVSWIMLCGTRSLHRTYSICLLFGCFPQAWPIPCKVPFSFICQTIVEKTNFENLGLRYPKVKQVCDTISFGIPTEQWAWCRNTMVIFFCFSVNLQRRSVLNPPQCIGFFEVGKGRRLCFPWPFFARSEAQLTAAGCFYIERNVTSRVLTV